MQAQTLFLLQRGGQNLAPASGTDFVRLMDLQAVQSGVAPRVHVHTSAQVTDFTAAVMAILVGNGVSLSGTGMVSLQVNGGLEYFGSALGIDSGIVSRVGHTHTHTAISDFTTAVLAILVGNGVALSGTGSVPLLANGGLKYTGSALGVDSGIVSLRGHTHLTSDILDFQSALLQWALANGVPLSGVVTLPLAPGGGLQYMAGGLGVNSGVVSFVGHKHVASDITDLPVALAALLLGDLSSSGTVTVSGTGPFSFNVRMAPAGGLTSSPAGLAVDLGPSHTQAAYGDHTHAQLHDPLTLGSMNSISGTLSGQRLSMEVIPVPGGGLLVTPSGVQVDFSVVQRMGSSSGTQSITTLNTPTLRLTLQNNVLSGVVPLDAAPPSGTGGRIVAGANGLRVDLGPAGNQAAPGNHVHAAATELVDGFFPASDKTRLDTLWGAAAPSGVQVASTQTLRLGMTGTVISGTVLYNTNPLFGKGAMGSDANGLYVVLGSGSNMAAAGNHLHDGRYLQLGGGTLAGALYLSSNPTSGTQAATKSYVDAVSANLSNYVPIAGGVSMTGLLTLSANPTAAMGAATKQYVDAVTTSLGGYVPLAGAVTMAGLLVLSGDPAVALGAATKQYVDAVTTSLGGYVPLTGAVTMTGLLTLSGDPATALEAATKQYVDGIFNATLSVQTGIATFTPAGGWVDSAAFADFQNLVTTVNAIVTLLNALGLPT